MTALIAKNMLQKNPGSIVLYNIVCGKIVPETIKKFKGKAVISGDVQDLREAKAS